MPISAMKDSSLVAATLKAPNLDKFPGHLVKLEKYNDITGSLTGQWSTNQDPTNSTVKAHPLSPLPGTIRRRPIIATCREWRHDLVRIEQARSTAPGLESRRFPIPIELTYRGQLLSERSERCTLRPTWKSFPG